MGRYDDAHRSARGRRACTVGAATPPSASTSARLEAMREWMLVMRDPLRLGVIDRPNQQHGPTLPGLCPFVIRRIFTP